MLFNIFHILNIFRSFFLQQEVNLRVALTWQYISPSMFLCAQADAMIGGKSTNITTLFAMMMLRKYGDRSNCLKAGRVKTNSVNAWNTQPTIKSTTILAPKPKYSASFSREDIFALRLREFFTGPPSLTPEGKWTVLRNNKILLRKYVAPS